MADDPNIPRIGQSAQQKPAQAPQQPPGVRQMSQQQQAGQVQNMAAARQAGQQPQAPADGGTGVPGLYAPTLKQAGHGEAADSWVGTGPNKPIAPEHVEKAISPEVLDQLAQQTGMSRDEILQRLSKDIPDAVDEMTPQGTLPPEPTGKGPWAA